MDGSFGGPSYDDAIGWWGPIWVGPEPRTILALLAGGVIDTGTAAVVWSHLARRGALAVVAGPSGAGKTTLLTALLDVLPADERRIYLRGVYEPFTFLTDPRIVPTQTALLVNEISPHLPIYLWGPAVRRFLACAGQGYRLLATAHASSAQEVVGQLAGYPLRIPAPEIASLQLVVVLRARRSAGHVERRVVELTGLQATDRGGIALHPILRAGSGTVDLDAAERWLRSHGSAGLDARQDLQTRTVALERLLRGDDAGGPSRTSMAERLSIALHGSTDRPT